MNLCFSIVLYILKKFFTTKFFSDYFIGLALSYLYTYFKNKSLVENFGKFIQLNKKIFHKQINFFRYNCYPLITFTTSLSYGNY